jgi:hypothetical protein
MLKTLQDISDDKELRIQSLNTDPAEAQKVNQHAILEHKIQKKKIENQIKTSNIWQLNWRRPKEITKMKLLNFDLKL